MHVLQLIASNRRRGAEIFALDLAPELADLGHGVSTVAVIDAGGNLEVPALGARRLETSGLRRLRSLARSSDVVVAHGSITLEAAAIAAAGLSVPLIYRNIGDPTFWAGSGLRRLRTRVLLRRVQRVAVLWPGAAVSLQRLFGLADERLVIIPNGVPERRCRPLSADERLAVRAELGLARQRPTICYVGALTREKRVERIITAVARMPHVSLVIVGEGALRGDLEALAAEHRDRIRFLGSRSDAVRIMAASDVVVLTSDSEGMPGVLIEASLCGVPSVATDVGGVREVVADGRTGCVVAPGEPEQLLDALSCALSSSPVLGAAARRWSLERFDIGVIGARWDRLLRSGQ